MSKLFLNGRLCNGNARSKTTDEEKSQYTLDELKQLAKDNGVSGVSKLGKEALCQAILDFSKKDKPMIVGPPMVKQPVAVVPVVVRASSIKAPRQNNIEMSDDLRDKVDAFGITGNSLQSLSTEEILCIINEAVMGAPKDSTLIKLVSNAKYIKGWVNCFTGKVVKHEQDSFYEQLKTRIQCYKKYGDGLENIDHDDQCVEQSDKKYQTRDSPAYPANQCCGKIMHGNPKGKNGDKRYESRADKNGTCKWYLLK